MALLFLLLCWALLCTVHLRHVGKLYDPKRAAAAIRTQYEQLGPPSYPEVAVGVDFVVLALLWISRDPKVIPGWGAAFTPGHVTDGTVAITMALLLFALPSRPPHCPVARRSLERASRVTRPFSDSVSTAFHAVRPCVAAEDCVMLASQ